LERMLAKEAGERFESGRAFHQALVPCLRERAVAHPPTPARDSGRHLRALSWGLVGAAIFAAALFLMLSRKEPSVPAAPVRTATPTPIPVPVPKTQVTISLVHRIRRGTLVVSLDGRPILTEEFSKPKLAIFKTTTWDPVV